MLRSITGQRLHQNQILELPLRVSTHQVMPTVAVFYFHSVVCLQTNPGAIPPGYSHELRCQVGVFIVQVQQHHSAPSLPTLAESSRTDSVQARPFWLTCRNGTAPTYLVDELLQFADFGIRSHLVNTISVDVITGCQPSALGYLTSPIAAARTCNALPRRHIRPHHLRHFP